MRVAVYHNQPSGGARRALYQLGSGLSEKHEIDVFTLTTAQEDMLRSADFASHLRVETFVPRAPRRFGFYVNDARRMLDVRDLDRVCRGVARAIDDGRYDVVLVDVCRFTQAPSVLAYLRTPAAYYCHEPPRRFLDPACRPEAAPLTAYERGRLLWRWPATLLFDRAVQRQDRRNVRCAARVLTNSEHTRARIREYYGVDAAVCRLGVDAYRFSPGDRSDTSVVPYVLSVGALEPHKGFEFLVSALAQCDRAMRPRLVIAGNTDDARLGAHLRRSAHDFDVDIEVRVAITDDELVGLYRGARAFVYAPYGEPFGLAVLEAMACALPVIAVAEGGPVEVIADGATGVLCPRDPAAFAAAVTRVLEDDALASRLGGAARATVERQWTWQAAAAGLEEYLLDLASEPRRRAS